LNKLNLNSFYVFGLIFSRISEKRIERGFTRVSAFYSFCATSSCDCTDIYIGPARLPDGAELQCQHL